MQEVQILELSLVFSYLYMRLKLLVYEALS
jgi:hypothetical protein